MRSHAPVGVTSYFAPNCQGPCEAHVEAGRGAGTNLSGTAVVGCPQHEDQASGGEQVPQGSDAGETGVKRPDVLHRTKHNGQSPAAAPADGTGGLTLQEDAQAWREGCSRRTAAVRPMDVAGPSLTGHLPRASAHLTRKTTLCGRDRHQPHVTDEETRTRRGRSCPGSRGPDADSGVCL